MTPSHFRRTACLVSLTKHKGSVLGLAELAKVLAITVPAAWNRKRRGQLPPPHTVLACGPVWTRAQVRSFIKEML